MITIVEPDDDYLGIDIHACNERFGSSTFVYAGLEELTNFANHIAGFPKNDQDQRTYEFGSREPSMSGGFCSLRFRCVNRAGHVPSMSIEEDDLRHGPASAEVSLHTEAAAIDRFVEGLRKWNADAMAPRCFRSCLGAIDLLAGAGCKQCTLSNGLILIGEVKARIPKR